MTDYSWFKLLVRAVGLLLIGMGIPEILGSLGPLLYFVFEPQFSQLGGVHFLVRYSPVIAGAATQTVFGLYLFFGAQRLIDRCVNSVRGRCGVCGYDIRDLGSGVCPECGTPVAPRKPAESVDTAAR